MCYCLAAWKVIKAWLPAAAVKKIKFLTKSNMGEYITDDNRLEVGHQSFAVQNQIL